MRRLDPRTFNILTISSVSLHPSPARADRSAGRLVRGCMLGLADPTQRSAFPALQIECQKSRELAICTVGQHWQANFEWFAHAPLAIEEGVDAGAIELLRTGKSPGPLTDDEQLVYDLAREIITGGHLSDGSYARGIDALGNELMVELIGICGYYTLISFTLNVF